MRLSILVSIRKSINVHHLSSFEAMSWQGLALPCLFRRLTGIRSKHDIYLEISILCGTRYMSEIHCHLYIISLLLEVPRSSGSKSVPERRVSVPKLSLISPSQSVITIAPLPFLVLPATVYQQRRSDDHRHTQHADIDRMSSNISRCIRRQIRKGGNESS